ncbi:MAG: hypothetical protein FWB93_06805, partial [Oscillospiraceae bacterium]|nr:hypothetical protein [Oscillospiraceae bacterium]
NQKPIFLEKLYAAAYNRDISHFVDPAWVIGYNGENVNVCAVREEECRFMDYCYWNKDVMVALMEYKNRLVLFGSCYIVKRDEIVQTTPPKTETHTYICADIFNVEYLDYPTLEDAVNDKRWDAVKRMECRVIDEVVYERFYGHKIEERRF